MNNGFFNNLTTSTNVLQLVYCLRAASLISYYYSKTYYNVKELGNDGYLV